MAKHFKQSVHVRHSKLGKVFQAGSQVSHIQEKLINKLRSRAFKAADKLARKRTHPLTFKRGGRAATARDKFAQYYAAKFGFKSPIGQHYAMATTRIKLLKGTPAQVKEVKDKLALRFMESHKQNARAKK